MGKFYEPATLVPMQGTFATKARDRLWLMFFTMGIVSMAWIPRIPEIKEANRLSDSEFGLVLISSSVGAVFGAQISGRLIHRYGSRVVMLFSAILVSVGVAIMGMSASPVVLVIGLFVMGFSYGALDVGGNAQAVAIEGHLSKRYIISFHGMWSLGTLAATIFGATVSHFLTPAQNLLLVAGVGLVVFILATRQLLSPDFDGHLGTDDGEEKARVSVPWFAIAVIPLWLAGIGASASMVAEGAAADWGALLLRDWMDVGKGYYASAFATFGIAMLISRFLGDRWLERFGPYRVVRYLGVIGGLVWGSAILLGVMLSSEAPLIAMVVVNTGFFFAGIAIGPMFPAFILAASAIKGVAPSIGIARVGVISIGAYFVGPTLVGVLSDALTLPYAMMYPALALVLAGYLGKVFKNN